MVHYGSISKTAVTTLFLVNEKMFKMNQNTSISRNKDLKKFNVSQIQV